MEARNIIKVKMLYEHRGSTKETQNNIENALNDLRTEGIFDKYKIECTIAPVKEAEVDENNKKKKNASVHEIIAKVIRRGNYSEFTIWGNVRSIRIDSVIYNQDLSTALNKMVVDVYQPETGEIFKNTYWLLPISTIDLTEKLSREERTKMAITFMQKIHNASKKNLEKQIIEENEFVESFDLFRERDKVKAVKEEHKVEIDAKERTIEILEKEKELLQASNDNLKATGGIDAKPEELDKMDRDLGKKVITELKSLADELDEDADNFDDMDQDISRLLMIAAKIGNDFYPQEFIDNARQDNIHLNLDLCLELKRRTGIELN